MSTDLAVQNVNQNNGQLALPEHLQQFAGKGSGIENMTQYIQPQWLKIIQDRREDAFKPFEPQTVIFVPDKLVVIQKGEELVFTPIMSYDEFVCRNPYQMKSTLPFKRESSFDPNSEVAQKARKLVRFKCPEAPKDKNWECIYQTVIHFIFSLKNPNIDRQALVGCSFSGGEFRTGRNLIKLVQQLSVAHGMARSYSFNMRAIVAQHHDKAGNDWYGFDVIGQEPNERFVTTEEYQYFDKQFQFFTENRGNIISADDAVETEPAGEVPTTL